MKKKQNNSERASALQILLALALISTSAVLLAAVFTPQSGDNAGRGVAPGGTRGKAANDIQAMPLSVVPVDIGNGVPVSASPNSVSCPLAMITATAAVQDLFPPAVSGDGTRIAFVANGNLTGGNPG